MSYSQMCDTWFDCVGDGDENEEYNCHYRKEVCQVKKELKEKKKDIEKQEAFRERRHSTSVTFDLVV